MQLDRWKVLIALGIGLSMASSLLAQVLYGSLTGNVTDSTDAAIPNAKVAAVNANTGIERQVVTDERGAYVFNDLQAGVYNVSISAPSFGSVQQSGVRIDANTVR